MIKNPFYLILALVAIIAVVLIVFFVGGGESEAPEGGGIGANEEMSDSEGTDTDESDATGHDSGASQTYTVRITSGGFEPATMTAEHGDTVIFRNDASSAAWPASFVHPTHTVYPGSGIEKCGTSAQGSIFDACRGLATGESFSFQFNEHGTWRYHNHLNPGMTGTIVVE